MKANRNSPVADLSMNSQARYCDFPAGLLARRSVLLGFMSLICLIQPISAQEFPSNVQFPVIRDPVLEKRVMAFNKKKTGSEEEFNKALFKLIQSTRELGYITASVDSVTKVDDTAYVWFYTGNRPGPFRINFDDESLPAAYSAGFRSRMEGRDITWIRNTLVKIVGYLNQNGYPLAKAVIQDITLSDDTVVALSRIEKGAFYTWDTLEIKGGPAISNVVLQKLIRIREKQPYNNLLMRDIDRQINSLPFVKQVQSYSLILTESNKARILLNLEKAKSSDFNGILGFGPDKENPRKLIFSGEMVLNLTNAFAQAEQMEIRWNGIQGDQHLIISYRQPFLPLLPFGIMYNFDLYKQGEIYYTLNQRGGLLLRSGPGSWFSAYYQRKNSKVLDRTIFDQYTFLPPWTDYSASLFGIEYHHTRTDHPRNPSRGISLAGDIAAGQKKLLTSPDIPEALFEDTERNQRQVNGHFSLETFTPVTERWVIRPSVAGSFLYGGSGLENELFLFGGIQSIRGIDENSLRASSYLLYSLEVRYRFEQESHFKLFIDGCWYEKSLQHSYFTDTPWGFGLGVAIPSPAGIIQMSYAYGIQQGNPFDFRTGRLHVGLVSLF